MKMKEDRGQITESRSTKTFPIKLATTPAHRQAAVDLLLEIIKEE